MKKIFVKNMPENLEREICECFYLSNVSYTYSDGKKWQDLSLHDITGRMVGKLWSERIDQKVDRYVGKIVKVTGRVEMFRDLYGMRLISVVPAAEGEWDDADFKYFLSEEEKEDLKNEYRKLLASMENPGYRGLLEQVYNPGRLNRMLDYPASVCHHTYDGGAFRHMVETVRIALHACSVCERQDSVKIDRDLVIAGALLHDIHVLSSIKPSYVEPRQTLRDRMVGAVADAASMVTFMNSRLADGVRVKDLSPLLNVIIGCNTQVDVLSKEAAVVRCSEQLSAAYNAFDTEFTTYDRYHQDENASVIPSRYHGVDIVRKTKKGE